MNWQKHVFHWEKLILSLLQILIFGLKKSPEYSYRLFEVLPEQATCEKYKHS